MKRGTEVEIKDKTLATYGETGVVLDSGSELIRIEFVDGSTGYYKKEQLKPYYDPTEGMAAEHVFDLLSRVHAHLVLQGGFWNKSPEGTHSPLRDADVYVIKAMGGIYKDFELDCPTPDTSDIKRYYNKGGR